MIGLALPRTGLLMPSLTRLLPLLALCAVTSSACKDLGNSPPAEPATSAAGAPTDTPVEAPAAGDAVPPVAGGAAPVDPGAAANVVCTPDTRKGGICTREYRPVCGAMGDGASKTFANKCVACSDEKVTSYVEGPCPGQPPG
jgi:hypothetical protein